MTPDELDWPPPICAACAHEFHEHCVWITGCECPSSLCLPLQEET